MMDLMTLDAGTNQFGQYITSLRWLEYIWLKFRYWTRRLCELSDLRTRCWKKSVWMEKYDGLDDCGSCDLRTRCWNNFWVKKYPTSIELWSRGPLGWWPVFLFISIESIPSLGQCTWWLWSNSYPKLACAVNLLHFDRVVFSRQGVSFERIIETKEKRPFPSVEDAVSNIPSYVNPIRRFYLKVVENNDT